MAVLTTIAVILGAWCAVGVATAALYAVLRARHVRRQRALASAPEGTVCRCARTAGSGERGSPAARTAPIVARTTAPDGA
ncbi:hypothetical protein [Streptomyces sp. NRRL F-2580]|uniref:hypothetical protein n=1 Tax=Streptomyces sp. NRRL F-2580 TaxID=1463841 RepID=UPI0004C5D415|nr:hypothetical protein [Streptomyces sp. NRRL F-2580]